MSGPPCPPALTHETFLACVSDLAARDPGLARVVADFGNPPFSTHEPGFPGLVMGILAQQVSLESARAAFAGLVTAIGTVGPEAFLSLDDDRLRAIGFSRQKASYARGLARGILAGEIDLPVLEALDDDEVLRRLVRLRGIGAWTAGTYLLFALRRPDAWPSGDLALAKAIQEIRGLAAVPPSEDVDRIADEWRPYRAVAARILWHQYLTTRGRVATAWQTKR